jgi:hypothetical protein
LRLRPLRSFRVASARLRGREATALRNRMGSGAQNCQELAAWGLAEKENQKQQG